ncbi:hypothetical protein TREES_T100009779 [Tupaia chinensis]|uniref:Uncharacterized protein n=1 Tax=Tupaia chinensis TaxID=246437 RepID=L9KR12_TUPCH|nr:hypothetical protein TREES_T100009779 [Tupaia chinensis]
MGTRRCDKQSGHLETSSQDGVPRVDLKSALSSSGNRFRRSSKWWKARGPRVPLGCQKEQEHSMHYNQEVKPTSDRVEEQLSAVSSQNIQTLPIYYVLRTLLQALKILGAMIFMSHQNTAGYGRLVLSNPSGAGKNTEFECSQFADGKAH